MNIRLLYFFFFLSGFAAISLEVLWTRILIMVIGGSVYAFAIVLVAFLAGTALGSLLISPFIGRLKKTFIWFAVLEILIGALIVISIPFLGNLPFWFLDIYKSSGGSFALLQIGLWILAGGVMFVPTLLMGAVFPIALRALALISADQNTDKRGSALVGEMYALNTIGGVIGSLAGGFVFIPFIGVWKGILVSGILYLMIGLWIIFISVKSLWIKGTIAFVTLIIILIGLQFETFDKSILSAGFYKDPDLYTGKDKETLKKQQRQAKVLFEKEGISAHVAVTQGLDGVLSLKINGKADASTGEDMENQLLLGHLPMFLHPSSNGAKEVLVVGMGSGITLGSILSHPVEHVDAIEIEEKVVEAARFFNKYSNNALDDPRVNIIVGDGRNYLLANVKCSRSAGSNVKCQKYDVITSEPSNPWLSGSSKLFTKEYFELLKKGIKEDGVVLQWINLYALDMEGLKRVIAAFDQVFPHTIAFGMPASNDLALIGSNVEVKFDLVLLEKRMNEEKTRLDFAKVRIKDPFEILAYFVMGEKEIKKLVGDTPSNTDNYPYVEFSAPRYLYQPINVNPWRVISEHLTPMQAIVAGGSLINADKKTLIDAENFRKSRLLTQVYSIEHNVGEGIKEGEKALVIDPDNIFIKDKLAKFYFEEGTSFFNQSQYSKAISSLSKSLNLIKTPEAYFNLGQTYGWDGNLEKAKENYEFAVKLDPEFEQGWMWLADTASQLGDLNGAISSYQKVVRINPKSIEVLVNLGNLYILRQDFGKAEEFLNKVLELDPNNEEAQKLIKTIP